MVDQLTAARQAVGPKIDICADMHARYDYPTGQQVAKRLEPLNLMWLEEPVPAENIDAYKLIADSNHARQSVPARTSTWRTGSAACSKSARWTSSCPTCRRPAASAKASGSPTSRTSTTSRSRRTWWRRSSARWRRATCVRRVPNFMILEWQTYFDTQPMWKEIVTYDGPWVEKGFIRVSEKPGIGVDINEEAMRKYASSRRAFFCARQFARQPARVCQPPACTVSRCCVAAGLMLPSTAEVGTSCSPDRNSRGQRIGISNGPAGSPDSSDSGHTASRPTRNARASRRAFGSTTDGPSTRASAQRHDACVAPHSSNPLGLGRRACVSAPVTSRNETTTSGPRRADADDDRARRRDALAVDQMARRDRQPASDFAFVRRMEIRGIADVQRHAIAVLLSASASAAALRAGRPRSQRGRLRGRSAVARQLHERNGSSGSSNCRRHSAIIPSSVDV